MGLLVKGCILGAGPRSHREPKLTHPQYNIVDPNGIIETRNQPIESVDGPALTFWRLRKGWLHDFERATQIWVRSNLTGCSGDGLPRGLNNRRASKIAFF